MSLLLYDMCAEGITNWCRKCNVLAGCLEMLKISATNPRSLMRQESAEGRALSLCHLCLKLLPSWPRDTNPSKIGTQKRNEVSGFLLDSVLLVSSSGPLLACNCLSPRRRLNLQGGQRIGMPHPSNRFHCSTSCCTSAGCNTSALWLKSLNLSRLGAG